MERVVIAAAIIVVATVVAVIVERRRPAPPTQARWAVPAQLDRADFARSDAPWLVVVFTSETCESCADAVAKTQVLASGHLAVQDVEAGRDRELHARYGIDAVPMIVVADRSGVVRRSFVGPPTATDLWAAVAEERQAD